MMKDLIDREELLYSIECLPFYHEFWKTEGCEGLWDSEDVVNRIKNMPSAQQWIPVTERLPDTYTSVLVSDGKYVWVDSLEDDFDGNGEYVVWWDSSNLVDFDKTAWMPLPEPWEGEEK